MKKEQHLTDEVLTRVIDKLWSRTGEDVVTEILFPPSGNFAVRKYVNHSLSFEDPKVVVDNNGQKTKSSFQFVESQKLVVSKIIEGEKEENVELEVLITEHGKIVVRSFEYPENGNVLVKVLYPEAKTEVKSYVLFSSSGLTETKKVIFDEDPV